MGKFQDLTGKTFGRLRVLRRAEDYISPKGFHRTQWLCECSCEKKTQLIVIGNNLIKGFTRSCGCIHDERASELGKSQKKFNTYIDKGDYYDVLTDKGNHFFIDKEDKEKVDMYYWEFNSQGHVVHRLHPSGKFLLLHRIIMGAKDGEIVDHKTHPDYPNPIVDNRKSNLRITTPLNNSRNKCKTKANTSGVTGVSWCKRSQKWCAQIGVNRKTIHLGYFDNLEDAAQARKEAEEKYFKEFQYSKYN